MRCMSIACRAEYLCAAKYGRSTTFALPCVSSALPDGYPMRARNERRKWVVRPLRTKAQKEMCRAPYAACALCIALYACSHMYTTAPAHTQGEMWREVGCAMDAQTEI